MQKIIVLSLCLLLAACAPSAGAVSTAIVQTQEAEATIAAGQSCPVDAVLQARDDLDNVSQKWSDAFDIANATGRGNLSGPVSKLQEVRLEADAVIVPPCLAEGHLFLIGAMGAVIQGFLDFMAQKPDATVDKNFQTAAFGMDKFRAELDRVVACAPACEPTPTPAP